MSSDSRTRAARPSSSRSRPEQDVLRADVVVLELPRLFLREDDDLAGSLCKSLEHVGYLLPEPLSSSTVARSPRRPVDAVGCPWKLSFFFGRCCPLDQSPDGIRAPGVHCNNGSGPPLSGPISRMSKPVFAASARLRATFEKRLQASGLSALAQRGEQHDLADRVPAGQHHQQPVDAEPQPAGRAACPARARAGSPRRRAAPPRRRPPAAAAAARSGARCSSGSFSSLKAFATSMPPMNPSKRSTRPGLGAVRLRERRQLDRVVEHERGLRRASARRASTAARRRACPSPVPGSGFASMPARAHRRRAARPARVCSAMSMPVSLQDRVAQRHPPPRRREVDRLARRARPARARSSRARRAATSSSVIAATSQVVGVGLVGLEHRELGVVLVGDALVAEVLAELVDLLEPADDQPLQVQLGRDPQVQRAVERVVVGREGARERAAVERLQHRASRPRGSRARRGSAAPRVTMRVRRTNSSRASSFAIRSSSRWR